jgi:ABC-2 type transport system permease protein
VLAALAPYWQVARRSFRRYSTYRAATFAGVFTNTVFGFLKVYILLAVMRQRSHIGSFDTVDVVTFTFVSQGFLATVGLGGTLELGDRIQSGDVVSDLYRPLHFQSYWLAHDLGQAAYQALGRGIPPVLVGALAFRLRFPANAAVWVAFLASFTLAVLVGSAFRFIVALTGFWLLDIRGVWQLATIGMWFFSGFMVPLTFFPAGLDHVARLLPFAALIQVPIEVFLGKQGAAGALAGQLFWVVALIAIGELIARRAFRKVVIQGG